MSGELSLRNQMIYEMYASGYTLQEIALQHHLTPQRISQIVTSFQPDLSDDVTRALEVAKLQYAQAEMLKIIRNGPSPKVDVKGEVVHDDHGHVIPDYDEILKAADVLRKLNSEVRRAQALDKPRRKQIVEDEAMKQAKAWLAQTFAQGEVVDETETEIDGT